MMYLPSFYALQLHLHKSLPVLLEHGAKFTTANSASQTPLHLLAIRGDEGLSSVLSSPEPSILSSFLQGLLAYNLDLNKQDVEGSTALLIAALAGSQQLVSFLTRAGASISLPDKSGRCPLDSTQQVQYTAQDGHITKLAMNELILLELQRPPDWVPDKLISNCQLCKKRVHDRPCKLVCHGSSIQLIWNATNLPRPQASLPALRPVPLCRLLKP